MVALGRAGGETAPGSMTAAGKSSTTEERATWLVSILASVVINAALGLTLLSVSALERMAVKPLASAPPPAPDLLVQISPEMLKAVVKPAAPAPEVSPPDPDFARTSADQLAERPDRPRYFGERDTRATSDAPPVAGALEVPSLSGAEPRRDEVEATQSTYEDGEARPQPALASVPADLSQPLPAQASLAVPPADLASPVTQTEPLPEVAEQPAPAPAPADLLQGPSMIDAPERIETASVEPSLSPGGPRAPAGEQLRETPPDASQPSEAQQQAQAQPSLPKPPSDPAFRGNQEKTKMQGSISRKGKAALDVADTPLGRYQAQLSRAVELEWQRNCVRYRDLITPGFITVRFVIDSKGKVTTVSLVEVVEVGEVQKGFTINSIRKAEIPPMPAALARELKGEPLELTFNFYF